MSLKVFISYAKEDRDRALTCYERFAQEGVTPWIDVKHILPGQNWEAEIAKALGDANLVVLLLSKRSVTKRGFVQREANDAIDRLRYKLPTDIYIIPLLLESCEVPSHISARLQYVDLRDSDAWEKIGASLKVAAEQQSIELSQGLSVGLFKIFTDKFEEQWRGFPGHDVSIEYPRFLSTSQPEQAAELTKLFAGRAVRSLVEARQKPWDQSPELFPHTNDHLAMNGRWDRFSIAHATGRLLSMTYDVGWYGAGAAHPNSYFQTYNFSLVDRLRKLDLPDFFADSGAALKRISDLCIQELTKSFFERVGEKPDEHQLKWFQSGAGEDFENFTAFTVNNGHFTFLFPPYRVSAYALGSWSADVSFYDLLDTLKPDGPHTFATNEA